MMVVHKKINSDYICFIISRYIEVNIKKRKLNNIHSKKKYVFVSISSFLTYKNSFSLSKNFQRDKQYSFFFSNLDYLFYYLTFLFLFLYFSINIFHLFKILEISKKRIFLESKS